MERKSKKDRRRRGEGVPTTVKGIRAENSFWDMCDSVSKIEGTSRNDFIVGVVSKHCKKVVKRGK